MIEDDIRGADEISDWLDKQAKKNPKIGKVIDNARLFGELKSQPAWIKLYDIIRSSKGSFVRKLSERVWNDPKKIPSSEEISYYKGFYQGAVWIVSHPEHAEKALENVARMAWLMSQGDEITDQEDDG